ncbi:MAG: hypothetical protein LLG04_10475 [Parachlamydia sp.]|nr:hypothetical protein [Parachlamydia sp.]
MKVTHSLYTLQPKDGRHARRGALLRFEFAEGIGYADCHPWESLGDLPLQHQLELLQQGRLTTLTSRSLHFARIDAKARVQGINLFEGLEVPSSQFLIPDLVRWNPNDLPNLIHMGYTHLKIKLGQDIDAEVPCLQTLLQQCELKVRLDFNNRLSKSQFESFLNRVDSQRIEFCEDPFPYDPISWREIQEQGVALALDQGSERAIQAVSSATYLIIKPAVQDESPFLSITNQKIVVTSYLDHPLGQMAAAYVAGRIMRVNPSSIVTCGLLSHSTYLENPFSMALKEGPDFVAPAGTGFGFDRWLN